MADKKQDRAKRIALNHIRHDVVKGLSETEIRLTRHNRVVAAHSCSVGLDQRMKGGKLFPTHRIVVYSMDGEDCLFSFSLKKLYAEISQEMNQVGLL